MYVTITYSTGPQWLPNTPLLEQSRHALRALASHRTFLARLMDNGKLILGGPYTDGTGGMALLEVKDKDEAEKILAEDPAIASGVFIGEFHQFVKEFSRSKC